MVGLVCFWVLAAGVVSEPTGAERAMSAVELVGPERVESGQSVVVSVGEPIGCVWQVQPTETRFVQGKNESSAFVVLLDLPPGRYFVSCVSFEKKLHATRLVEVSGGPGPGPSPAGRFGLAKEVRAWGESVAAEHRGASRDLANSFRSIRSAVVAGGIKDPAAILRETLASNNRALGSRVEAWRGWGSRLEERLTALHREGKLRSLEDYRDAWEEIAEGLDGVR